MSSFTYYYHCEHCKPTQDSCTESHFRPCGGVDCRGKYAWKTVTTSLDGAKNKTTIHSPPPNEIEVDPVEAVFPWSCWEVECTDACSKAACWFESREKGESLVPEYKESRVGMDWDEEEEFVPLGVFIDGKPFEEYVENQVEANSLLVADKMANRLNEHGAPKRKSDVTTHAEITEIIEDTFEEILELNATKGLEYANATDGLANFKTRASQLGLDPLQVWGIFYGKHSDAIYNYLKNGAVLSESIEGRIDDAILYLILLKGLIRERG